MFSRLNAIDTPDPLADVGNCAQHSHFNPSERVVICTGSGDCEAWRALAIGITPKDNVGMAFFSEKKLRRIRIEIDDDALKSDSPEIRKRLDRIEENYALLDDVLNGLEARFKNDESIVSLFAADDFVPEPVLKKKRKWRPRKPR